MTLRLKESLFDRRQFLRWLAGLGGAGVAASAFTPVWRFLTPFADAPPEAVDLGNLADLPANAARPFMYGQWASMVVRRPDGTLAAFNARCTHADCTVSYDSQRRCILCACHDGVYDLDGGNVSGPPPRPLQRYHLDQRDGNVVARLHPPAEPGEE